MSRMSEREKSHDKYKIIYVEDDAGMRDLLYEILNRDFDIYVTGCTKEAKRLCRTENIALVMSDHHMHPVTGIDFLKDLYSEFSNIRRVLITGDKSSDIILEAVQKGHIHGIFYKPLDFGELRQEIKEHIARYKEHIDGLNQQEHLKDEIKKLREALYTNNSQLFRTFSALRGADHDHNFDDLRSRIVKSLKTKIQSLLNLSPQELIQNKLRIYGNTVYEIQLISQEFNLNS